MTSLVPLCCALHTLQFHQDSTPMFAPPLVYDSFAGLTAATLAGRKP
jgi:hypothetical protein